MTNLLRKLLLRIAVINFSGNVGKTTTTRHLIAPRLGAKIISIETINGDEAETDAVKGKQFAQVMEALSVVDGSVVCDIGASNAEIFIAKMKEYAGSHEDFDYYVIPCVPDKKQIRDTISTIEALSDIGVSAEKIRVVFNKVDYEDDANQVFEPLLNYYFAERKFTFVKDAVVHVSDLFGRLTPSSSIIEIVTDATDYKAQLKAATSTADKQKLSRQIAVRRLAVGVNQELDRVFDALFDEAGA